MKSNDLLLLSGNDIPFVSAQLTIHQPTLSDISFIGEELFLKGCDILTFNKQEKFTYEDILRLENYSNFEILMSMINNTNVKKQLDISDALMVLDLIFPNYICSSTSIGWIFVDRNDKTKVVGTINKDNFDEFSQIIKQIFCLDRTSSNKQYNPEGELAQKIADRFKKSQRKLAELRGDKSNEKVAIYSRYASILAVNAAIDINTIMHYTVYQLFDQFERFELYTSNDIYFRARIAGASKMQEPENWMKDIHE